MPVAGGGKHEGGVGDDVGQENPPGSLDELCPLGKVLEAGHGHHTDGGLHHEELKGRGDGEGGDEDSGEVEEEGGA